MTFTTRKTGFEPKTSLSYVVHANSLCIGREQLIQLKINGISGYRARIVLIDEVSLKLLNLLQMYQMNDCKPLK